MTNALMWVIIVMMVLCIAAATVIGLQIKKWFKDWKAQQEENNAKVVGSTYTLNSAITEMSGILKNTDASSGAIADQLHNIAGKK